MSEIGDNLKNLVMKGIEVIGNKAESIASNAKQKVGEFNLVNEQKDVFSVIGSKVYEMFRQGIVFPDELQDDLMKASEISEELEKIRAEKEAEKNDEETEEETSYAEPETTDVPAKGVSAAEYAAENDTDVPVLEVDETSEKEDEAFTDCPLSSAISDLFEKMPPVDKMMDKVNSSLDELGDNLRKFSGEFDKQLNEFADQMMGEDKKDPKD